MTAPPPPRSRDQRRRDTLDRLERDVDCWVATAGPAGGDPYLVPLSFLWDGATLLLATATASPTARNLASSGAARLGLGDLRDVVLIQGAAAPTPDTDFPADVADAFAAKTGFDPRQEPNPYTYLRVTPHRIQAWRESNELPGRDIMRDAAWLMA